MIVTDPKSAEGTFEQMLSAKKRQMNSLLEVTRAINNNVPANVLWQSYESILTTHLGTKSLALFFFEHTWQKVVDIADELSEEGLPAWVLELTQIHKITKKEQADLPGFKYIIPVYHKEHALAYALIGDISNAQGIMESDLLDFATVITNVVVVAVENKRLFKREIEKKQMDKELELASRVQGMLIPSRLPKNAMYEFAGLYLPHRGIGGDYYDVIHVNRDEFYFCVADISGKGIASALVMANLQAYLNSSMMLNMPKEEFVKILNQKISSITRGDHFITLFIAKYNIRTRALRYLNAGHNPPILISDGKIKILEKGCTVLGAFEEIPHIEFGDEVIAPGTTIVCYTDGLTELENEEGEFYGMERLVDFVKQNSKLGPEIFNKILYDNVSKFKGNRLFNDDVSVLTCKLM